MTQSDQFDRSSHTERLLKRKLGTLPDWIPPKIVRSVGPFEPEIFDEILERRTEVFTACREKLASLTDAEFHSLISSDTLRPNQFERDWERFKEAEIEKMQQIEPAWYAGGFGHPAYAADFEYWSQSPHYTNHEALLLSLGVEPKHFTERQIDTMEETVKKGTELWPSLHYMLRRREQFRRQFPWQFDASRINPQNLFAWFELIDLEIPEEFTSRYVTHSKGRPNDNEDQRDKPTHRREIDTVAQLFTVMAIEYYGYRPQAARSPTPKEIVEAAAKVGIAISDDTVRKYLRLGASFISPDWKPDEF
ncbi:hypothetical protein [Sulfitobacter mediterraneus]|uniref:hypothetical protein n=1 Tax=Sulfitobacter mediterraneus TaxID=83219 RepID=UPI0021A30A5B|nr:hypothetical protein [Sulfitobacter mediterraneus]UWR09967.1 hypothetical protein K3753_11800 [Sulfitobacter mediterraneus]